MIIKDISTSGMLLTLLDVQSAMKLFVTNNAQTKSPLHLNPGLHSISLPSIYKDFKFIAKYQILIT